MSNSSIRVPTEALLGLYVAWIFIMLLSFVGNSLLIYMVFYRPNMKSPTNYQFVNMASADIIITVFSMPIWAYFLCLRNGWVDGTVGDVTCSIAAGASIVSLLASVLTLLTISVDRFLAVFLPLRRTAITRNTRLITWIIWFVSLVFGGPSMFVYSVREENGRLQCRNKLETSNMTLRKAYFIVMFWVMFVIPLAVMSIMYSMVAYRLWFREVPGNQSSVSRRSIIKAKRKIVRMLIILVLAFAACWLPVYVGWFIQVFASRTMQDTLYVVLPHANCALNPCLCFLLNPGFRRQLVVTFKACGKRSEKNF